MRIIFIFIMALVATSQVCFAQTVFQESFDGTTTPTGWTNTAVSGGPWVFSTGPDWGVAGTPDHTGNNGNYAWVDFSGEDTTVVLTTPAVDVSTLTTPYLEFAYESYVSAANYPLPYNILMVEAWNGTAWATVTNLQQNTAQGWEVLGYDLTGLTYSSGDSVRIRFIAESGGSSRDFENDLLIDDIEVKQAPACIVPTALAVGNITATTADISWTAGGGASTEIVIRPGGSPAPTGGNTLNAVTANPSTVSNLMAATTYDAYIRDVCTASSPLVISGVYDMPLPGGTPKGVELYVVEDIADLSLYGLGSANNGGGTDGVEFTFPAVSANAGDYIYVANDSANFHTYFGFAPSYVSGAMGINGDDAVELFYNATAVDVFGDINVDGTGQAWEYTDGWAYRNANVTSNGGTFNPANWTFSGPNAVDGCATNATCASVMPVGTFTTTVTASVFVGPVSFTTACAVFTPGYSTNFATFLPACWDEADNGSVATGPTTIGGGSWVGSGTLARINLWSTGKSDWLLSPEFDLTAGGWELVINASGLDFSGGAFSGMGSDDSVQVVISTDGGATWTTLYTFDANNPLSATPTDNVIDLSAYTGASNLFGILATEGAVNDSEDYYANIHNFEIRQPLTCANPTMLAAGNITGTTADITWTAGNASQLGWEVSVVPAGSPAMGGTAATSPYNATGLTPNTAYAVFVREICTAGDTTAWLGPIPFTTACPAVVPGDSVSNAIQVGNLPYNSTGNTSNCYTNTTSNPSSDVWYQMVLPACTDTLNVSLCASSYDTYLRIFAQDGTTELFGNDDGCGTRSQLVIDVTNSSTIKPGDVIYVLVEGFNTATGAYDLNIDAIINCPPPVDVEVTSYLNLNPVYCNAAGITGSVVITNNDTVAVSGVPYVITANGLPLATDTIATLGAMMSDTIVVGPVPVTATGPGVITTIVNVMGDINTANDTLTTTVLVSNTRANAAVAADVTCNGGADGSAGTGATGGFAPYTFAWSDGQTTADAIGLIAGMYIVTVTDTVGCSDIDTVTIAEPAAIVLSMASTNASCNGVCDGTGTATVTGGTAGYTYAWSNGMNTATATGLCATTYMVTVTDANGCTAMDSVVITEPTAVVAATTDNGDGTATATATGGAAPYTFAWDNGDATATTTSALNSGDTYCVTATDANGCTDTACVVVVFSSIEGTNGTASTMRMYPNPTSDNVFVAFDLTSLQTAELQLVNMAGQVVWEQSFDAIKDQTITINTAELPSGVYMMHTVVGAERISKKLVIARQ